MKHKYNEIILIMKYILIEYNYVIEITNTKLKKILLMEDERRFPFQF